MGAFRVVVAAFVFHAGAQLVGPGAMVPAGGSVGPAARRGGGWATIDKFPVGFFVGGSTIEAMNGLYVRNEARDPTMPHDCDRTWVHVDSGYKMATARVRGWVPVEARAESEWLFVDGAGRDVLATPGGSYLPRSGPRWTPVNRPFRYWKVGDAAASDRDEAGFWIGGEAGAVLAIDDVEHEGNPILWRRRRDGKKFAVAAHRLVAAEPAAADVAAGGEDDDTLPWQIVGIMSRDRLEDLLEEKRRRDADEAAAFRRGGGGRARLDSTFGAPPVAGRLAPPGAAAAAAEVCESSDAIGDARAACRDGSHDGPEVAAVAVLVAGTASPARVRSDAYAALAYCRRRAFDADGAIAYAEAGVAASPRAASSLVEAALSYLDGGRYRDAIAALERAYASDRALPGLGTWMVRAHARARTVGARAFVAGADLCVGDAVGAVGDLAGFWRDGDLADVIGVAAASSPIALRMRSSGALYDAQRRAESQPIQDTFTLSVPERIFENSLSGRRGTTGSLQTGRSLRNRGKRVRFDGGRDF